jgi:hypothetical protein
MKANCLSIVVSFNVVSVTGFVTETTLKLTTILPTSKTTTITTITKKSDYRLIYFQVITM